MRATEFKYVAFSKDLQEVEDMTEIEDMTVDGG
jgi:hypothetical protein